jgi:hypothetical protein
MRHSECNKRKFNNRRKNIAKIRKEEKKKGKTLDKREIKEEM